MMMTKGWMSVLDKTISDDGSGWDEERVGGLCIKDLDGITRRTLFGQFVLYLRLLHASLLLCMSSERAIFTP